MTIDKIIELLNDFKPFEESDPNNDNISYLNGIVTSLKSNAEYKKAIEPIFRLMEKYPSADLGSPGPLVHTLEYFKGEYEKFLFDSLKRKPTSLTVWMLNRIINAEQSPIVKAGFIAFMASLSLYENIDDETKSAINGFVSFQKQDSE